MTKKENVPIKPSSEFIAKAIWQFYGDLKDAKNNDGEFVRTVKLATYPCNEIDSLRDPSSCPTKKARTQGTGRKEKLMK